MMKREKMIAYMDLLDEKWIAEADPANAKKIRNKRMRQTILHLGSLAACVCLIVMLLHQAMTPEIITFYKSNKNASYTSADPGEYYCFHAVNAAREQYAGKQVQFLLAIDMFSEGHVLSPGEIMDEEYKRLSALGFSFYEAEAWTYEGKGVKKYYPVIVGLFTEEDLQNFPAHPEIGYAFRFVTNGDGSALDFSKDKIVSVYHTNKQ
ncbi:MAG: hypothetical protein E7604_03655 [Ruminococcaceae bacterium]|nr:hypothetical protein [Oscillospiraceae bacterium]